MGQTTRISTLSELAADPSQWPEQFEIAGKDTAPAHTVPGHRGTTGTDNAAMGIQDIHLTMAIFIRWRSKTSTPQWFRLVRPAPGRQRHLLRTCSSSGGLRRCKASTLQWPSSRARHLMVSATRLPTACQGFRAWAAGFRTCIPSPPSLELPEELALQRRHRLCCRSSFANASRPSVRSTLMARSSKENVPRSVQILTLS